MANWFESNPTKSILSYTLVVVGATWAASTFVLQDNRLNLARSELEAQKALAEQYKAKSDLLQKDIEVLRSENAEYRAWLDQSKDAIPVIMPRITELKAKVAALESEVQQQKGSSASGTLTVEHTAQLGRAYVNDTLGVIVTVKDVNTRREAYVVVQLPDRTAAIQELVSPGKQWRFKVKEETYQLTVTEVDFLRSAIQFRIAPSGT